MKEVSIFVCLIFLLTFAGYTHSKSGTGSNSPITLPLETIKSKGTIVQQPFDPDEVELLEKTLDKIRDKTQAKGMSVAVAIPDKGIWFNTRGITGNPEMEKLTPDQEFYAGSIGKIYTSVVIFSLIDQGRLNLKTPIAKWFPEFPKAKKITINHLLTHTSGIVSYDNLKENEATNYVYQHPEQIILSVKNKKLLFTPGKHYSYSNTGYLILGIIIEKITGKTYKEAVDQFIINKIDLRETEVLTGQSHKNLLVSGHHQGNVLAEKKIYAKAVGAGSVIASPRDLISFLQALMAGRLVSEKSLQAIFENINRSYSVPGTYYGKGIAVALKTPVGDIIGHTGGTRGFLAALYYQPKKNIFVAVMMNDDIKAVEPAMFRLMETMMAD